MEMQYKRIYTVMQLDDIEAALTQDEIDQLHSLERKVAKYREEVLNKEPLRGLFIMESWPEFELAKDSIIKRRNLGV